MVQRVLRGGEGRGVGDAGDEVRVGRRLGEEEEGVAVVGRAALGVRGHVGRVRGGEVADVDRAARGGGEGNVGTGGR